MSISLHPFTKNFSKILTLSPTPTLKNYLPTTLPPTANYGTYVNYFDVYFKLVAK
jgi:hypothetical protein